MLHGVPRVHSEVYYHLLHLHGIHFHEHGGRGRRINDADILAYYSLQHPAQAADYPVEVQHSGLEHLPPAESQELPEQRGREARGLGDLVKIVVARVPGGQAFAQEVGVCQHGPEQIVQVVGDAGRKLADRIHFLGLEQRLFGAPLLGYVGAGKENSGYRGRAVQNGGVLESHYALFPVLCKHRFFIRLRRRNISRQERCERSAHLGPDLRRQTRVEPVFPQEFVLSVSQYGAAFSVYKRDPPVPVERHDHDSRYIQEHLRLIALSLKLGLVHQQLARENAQIFGLDRLPGARGPAARLRPGFEIFHLFPDAVEQRPQLRRFHYQPGRPKLERKLRLVFFAVSGGIKDNRNIFKAWIGFDLFAEHKSVHLRHHDVRNYEVGRGGLSFLQSRSAVRSAFDRVSELPQRKLKDIQRHVVVFGYKYLHIPPRRSASMAAAVLAASFSRISSGSAAPSTVPEPAIDSSSRQIFCSRMAPILPLEPLRPWAA